MEKAKEFLRNLLSGDKKDETDDEMVVSDTTYYWLIGIVMVALVVTLFLMNIK